MGSSGAAEDGEVRFKLSYRGQSYDIIQSLNDRLSQLYDIIYEKTTVTPSYQKIIASGPMKKVFSERDSESEAKEPTLAQLGFTSSNSHAPIKLMLVGPPEGEVEAIQKEDEKGQKMNKPRQYHPSMLRGTKPRSTINASSPLANPFHNLRVHQVTPSNAPEYDMIMKRLQKLSTDEAVVHVCKLHGFQVGELTELLPHEHPNLLGLNENMGQRISLRLRTDLYDGLQPYRDTRRVLLHELAHNKINDHPPEFKILNSELNAQVEAYERAQQQGTHRLIDTDVYIPPDDGKELPSGAAAGPTAHVLGGNGSKHDEGDMRSRREKVLQATMLRLEKVEAEIEKGCGSNG